MSAETSLVGYDGVIARVENAINDVEIGSRRRHRECEMPEIGHASLAKDARVPSITSSGSRDGVLRRVENVIEHVEKGRRRRRSPNGLARPLTRVTREQRLDLAHNFTRWS